MKGSVALTAALLIALILAGSATGQLFAGTSRDQTSAAVVSEQVKGGPTADQGVEMSEHALAAMREIDLARTAINDGYVENAKKLLNDARHLLKKVASEDRPVTVTTEVKVADEPVAKETSTIKADLIPILDELQIVESYETEQPARAAADDESNAPEKAKAQAEAGTNRPDQPEVASKSDTAGGGPATGPTHAERVAAVQKAREQLRGGDTQGAADTLQLVELDLVSQVVSMPLKETAGHVNEAISLVDKGKLHEANLELKKAKDGLVVETSVLLGPAHAGAAPPAAGSTTDHPAHRGPEKGGANKG